MEAHAEGTKQAHPFALAPEFYSRIGHISPFPLGGTRLHELITTGDAPNRLVIISVKLAILAITGGFLLLVTLSLLGATVAAQGNQVTASVSLNYLNIQVSYPSEVSPGDTVTAHVDANAKSSFYLVALTAQVFYADGNNIRQLVTKTLASNSYLSAGKSISGDIQITVPQDAPRTSMVAAFSERTQQNYYDYSSYYPYSTAYYVNYSSPYYAYYCDPYYANSQYCPYQYYSQYYPYSYYTVYYGYPSSSYTTTTDVGITSLPYIKATTPEAVTLQSQNQQLQQQLGQSQADNQKLQSDSQKLQQDLQSAQQMIAQQNSAANDMNQRLTSSNYLMYGLGALAAVFAVLAVHFRRQRGRGGMPQQQYAQYGQTSPPGEQQPPTPSKEQQT